MGYGIAAAKLTGHDRPFRFFTRAQFRVSSHPVPTPVAVDIPHSGWPSTAIAPSGRYDAQKFIDRVASLQAEAFQGRLVPGNSADLIRDSREAMAKAQ